MAVLWESFYPYVQPSVPGCPEITIQAYLREAAAQFCEFSEVWRFDIDEDFTSKSTSDYEIDVPTGAALTNILDLYLDGSPLVRVSDKHYSASPAFGLGRPARYALYQEAQVRFYPTPDTKYSFQGIGVLKPSLTSTGVEDFIFETHHQVISAGALAKLMIIPGKEWSNPELASFYSAQFRKMTDDANARDTRRVNLRVSPIGFARAPAKGVY